MITLLFSLISVSISYADLRSNLLQEISSTHAPISYKTAVLSLFTVVDNQNGVVCSVYGPSECLTTEGIPSHKVMNVEHTWPQSEGANGTAKSDLHHLYATSSATNSIRSSLPFCEVIDVKWSEDQSLRGYSKFGEHCFEPPNKHKGNVARALFYFAIRYGKNIDKNQEEFLREWHKADPVDQDEMIRHQKIFLIQKNTNPFILKPELVQSIQDF